jgi:hypothetical protein
MTKQFKFIIRRQIQLIRTAKLLFHKRYGSKESFSKKVKKVRHLRRRNDDGSLKLIDFQSCEWFQRINDPEVLDPTPSFKF